MFSVTLLNILLICSSAVDSTLKYVAMSFQDLHSQLRSKNDMMKSMKRQIKAMNGTLPELLDEQPDDDDWAW